MMVLDTNVVSEPLRHLPEVRVIEYVEELNIEAQFHALLHREPFGEVQVTPSEVRTAQGVASKISKLAIGRFYSLAKIKPT